MKPDAKPMAGAHRFQWSAGAWIGSSLGSTAWMLVTAFCLAYNRQHLLAIVLVSMFAFIIALSAILWLRRDRISPFAGYMTLLGALAIAMPATYLAVSWFASDQSRAFMNWPQSDWPVWTIVPIAPLIMGWFYYVEYFLAAPDAPDLSTSEPPE